MSYRTGRNQYKNLTLGLTSNRFISLLFRDVDKVPKFNKVKGLCCLPLR